MENNLGLKLDNYEKALGRLKESIDLMIGNPLGVDAVIKRFEFTYETAWKCLKAVLEDEKTICKTPRECFKKAYEYDYISSEDVWLDILDDRNLITHIYDQNHAEEVCMRVKNSYLHQFEKLLKFLKEKCS